MRIWRSSRPKISMPATPLTVSTRGLMKSLTYSLASTAGRSVMIGAHITGKPDTSSFCTIGGSTSFGRSKRARSTRSRTSCAARSRSSPISNSIEIEVCPCFDFDVSFFTPSIVLSCSSSSSVTSSSITSGLAPSMIASTLMRGISIFGYWSTPRRPKPSTPKTTRDSVSIHVSTGRWMNVSIQFISVRSRQPRRRARCSRRADC